MEHLVQDAPASEYVPVDSSFEARRSWPYQGFTTETDLNGRELGQFISGYCFGRAMLGERAWLIQVPTDKLAAVSAALVYRSFAVARESWADTTTTLAVWSGL